MIYYPLSTLMLAGIQDILIISTPEDTPRFEHLLGDGSQYGVHLSYKVQPSPDGLAQAFLLGEEFIGDDCCAMILGDNIFYGNGFSRILKAAVTNAEKNGRATVFGYYVNDPERFGIVEFDKDGRVISVEEKPPIQEQLRHHRPVLLRQPGQRPGQAGQAQRPGRAGDHHPERHVSGEGKLDVQLLGRGFAWLDTGTMDSLVTPPTLCGWWKSARASRSAPPKRSPTKTAGSTGNSCWKARPVTARAPTASICAGWPKTNCAIDSMEETL